LLQNKTVIVFDLLIRSNWKKIT